MSRQSQFTVVICHGACLSSASYSPLVNTLKSKGIETYCPQLASNDSLKQNLGDIANPDYDRDPPQGGYPQEDQDAEIILNLLRALIKEQGKRVLLVAHSTGSFAATEAAQHELQEKVRTANGLTGGILGILHFGGYLVPVGQSINSFYHNGKMEWPPKAMPFLEYHIHGWSGLVTISEPLKYIFIGMEPEEAEKWMHTLTGFPFMTTELTNGSYFALPWGYVFFEDDMILPKEFQGRMVATQTDDSIPIAMYRCQGGYSAYITCPEKWVENIRDFAKKIERVGSASGDEDSGVEIV